jgi:short-subunit dehydrogenase
MTQKIVVITGASNGMGYEAAELFAKRGWKVFAGARRVEKIPTAENITAKKLDVTVSASNHAFIDEILAETGHIDVLINNAGYGEYGPAEEISMAKIRKQFETNFFGAVELTQLVLPTMRAQHFGRIINISSIGSDIYTPLGAYYHATKAALQQWSNVLDLEVEPFGIRSICIQPGSTESNWREIALGNAHENLAANTPYKPLLETIDKVFEGFKQTATSKDLAEIFYKAATVKAPKTRYFNSFRDFSMVQIARTCPKLYRKVFKGIMNKASKKLK